MTFSRSVITRIDDSRQLKHLLYIVQILSSVPLINAIYEDNPLVGMYTLPLLIWHPMQLVLGTAVAPHVAAYVKTKQELLAREREDVENKNTEDTIKTMEMGATVQVNNSTEHDNSQHE